MPRRTRRDEPGAWHHVFNRGIARRTLFETARDIRMFLAALAWRVHAGDIEIHAYAILTTHFHLLVRSPRGRLSPAMQRSMDAYARWFNRSRERDGPVFKGRFENRIVDSDAYWDSVLRYIDRNPVGAGLAPCPTLYPHGSAWHYARAGGPRWLTRSEVEDHVRPPWEKEFRPSHYARFCELEPSLGAAWVVGRRVGDGSPGRPDPLDFLLEAAPPAVEEWMVLCARRADGTLPGVPVVSPDTVSSIVRSGPMGPAPEPVPERRNHPQRQEVLLAGLLRKGCGLRLAEIGRHLGVSTPTANARVAAYARLLLEEGGFRGTAARILREALFRDHSPLPRKS